LILRIILCNMYQSCKWTAQAEGGRQVEQNTLIDWYKK
jgi:hypothetical protein